MTTAITLPDNTASTFPTHFSGGVPSIIPSAVLIRSVRRLAVAPPIQYTYPTRSFGHSPGRWIHPLASPVPADDAI